MGKKVIDFRGQVGYSDELNRTYFRFGLYRDTMEEPMTVYLDGFSIQRLGPHK